MFIWNIFSEIYLKELLWKLRRYDLSFYFCWGEIRIVVLVYCSLVLGYRVEERVCGESGGIVVIVVGVFVFLCSSGSLVEFVIIVRIFFEMFFKFFFFLVVV